jgi:hypothetical protein
MCLSCFRSSVQVQAKEDTKECVDKKIRDKKNLSKIQREPEGEEEIKSGENETKMIALKTPQLMILRRILLIRFCV